MRLFDIVPERFFGLLAGRGRAVYADALFLLYDLYRRNLYGIRRDDVAGVLTDLMVEREEAGQAEDDWLEDDLWDSETASTSPRAAAGADPNGANSNGAGSRANSAQESESPTDPDEPLPTDPRAKANAILRRMKDAGWIDIEPRANYEDYVNLMDYAVQVLETLDRIRTRKQTEYRGFVFQTYLALASDEAQREGHLALQAAYENTEALVRELKSLNHNIRRYTERLLEQKRPQDILATHFLEYQGEILSRSYHQLKTSDHVSRYRPKILAVVRAWLRDEARISAAAEGILASGQLAEKRQAQAEVMRRLAFIETSYDSVDALLHEIDWRNAQYAKNSLEQVRYMLNSSQDTEGQLIDLLKFMGEQLAGGLWDKREEVPGDWQPLFSLGSVEALEDRSLFTPRRVRDMLRPMPLARQPVDEVAQQKAIDRLRQQLADRLTVERVNHYVLSRIAPWAELQAADLDIETTDDFLFLIHMAAYTGSRKAAYHIDFNGPRVESAGGRFRFRNVTIRRKKHG
ncbi:MAG: DUF5716 family protein [Firmicutes bacterium]|nr:DUF5716 family protein [Bacillota bacterium]